MAQKPRSNKSKALKFGPPISVTGNFVAGEHSHTSSCTLMGCDVVRHHIFISFLKVRHLSIQLSRTSDSNLCWASGPFCTCQTKAKVTSVCL